MNKNILSKEVQAYLREHRTDDPAVVALQRSPFERVSPSELAQQLDGWQRCRKKIPDWTDRGAALYYPEKIHLEQCSSSETGRFKASLIEPGSGLIDLTGGFGVDIWYFAQRAEKVVHCERLPLLSEIAAHNTKMLGTGNIQFHQGNGIAHLQSYRDPFDYLYSDPSRRVNGRKVFRLEDCEPNILENQDLFFSKAQNLITKTAPLLDISLALRTLSQVRDVHVVSVDNDCKELIFVQQKGYAGAPNIHAVRIRQGIRQVYSFGYQEEKNAQPIYGMPIGYLYEPDVALTKAGAFKSPALRYSLNKLHANSHLYTSEALVADFPGKILRIEACIPLTQFKNRNEIRKANVIAKNFPLKVEDIRKKFNIRDGGERSLYFTTLADGKMGVVLGEVANVR